MSEAKIKNQFNAIVTFELSNHLEYTNRLGYKKNSLELVTHCVLIVLVRLRIFTLYNFISSLHKDILY